MNYIITICVVASILLVCATFLYRRANVRLKLAEPILADMLDAAEALVSDDSTPELVVDLAQACAKIRQYRLVCLLWIIQSFQESDQSDYYDLLEQSVDSMNEQQREEFGKLIGAFVLYSTLRAGLLGALLRRIVAPYVKQQNHHYKGASSGMDLAIGLVSTHPDDLRCSKIAA